MLELIPFGLNGSVFQDDNSADVAQVLQLMRHENSGFSAQILVDAFLEHVLAHMGVHGAQGIIQKIYVCLGINGPRQIYPAI